MAWRIGVDIGGTFTDLCAHDDETGIIHTLKVLSQPDHPGADVALAVTNLAHTHHVALADVMRFTHGTTVGVNTIIQRRGAVLALFATEGFTDVLELARLRMPDAYSLFGERAAPLVPKDRVFGIVGRLLADGSELAPLEIANIDCAIAAARAAGATGVIVSLLHSWRNPAHEIAVVTRITEIAPDLFVFRSTEIWPAIREFERTSTAVLNGYVHPRIARYLERLEAELSAAGVRARPLLTRSNGGVMAARQGRRDCVGMLLSGTACGVMGAAFVAAEAGVRDAVTLDVGGTSADVALLIGGRAQFATGENVGGFPLFVPSVAVSSIGAGGGSIARVDAFGVLKVGPDSAGSTPGPACYGRGGLAATLTDAFAVRGVLGHGALGFGAVSPDLAAARAAIATVARDLGRSIEMTAEDIAAVAVSAMYLEVSKLFARNAADLADITLIAFGGAGPMVGCALARELGISSVMIPMAPGVVCALGGLVAEIRNDLLRTVMVPLDDSVMPMFSAILAELERDARAWLADVAEPGAIGTIELSADMRYRGQSYEIEVPFSVVETAAMATSFHTRHHQVFDHADIAAPIEVVNLRLAIRAGTAPLASPVLQPADGPPPSETIRIFLDGDWCDVALYRRATLLANHEIAGPAVVVQDDTTFLLPRNSRATVQRNGHLMVTL